MLFTELTHLETIDTLQHQSESICLVNVHIATATASGNVYCVPIEKIRSVNDLITGIIVHNISGTAGSGALIPVRG